MSTNKPLQFNQHEPWESKYTGRVFKMTGKLKGCPDKLYQSAAAAAAKESQVAREAFVLGGFVFSEHDKFGKPAQKIIKAAKKKLRHKKQLFPVKVMTAAEYASQK